MRYFHEPVKLFDLIKSVDTWRKSTMEAENTVLDNGREREEVEERSEVLPHISISILSEALIVETVDLGDLLTFVVSSQNGDTIRKSYLEAYEE